MNKNTQTADILPKIEPCPFCGGEPYEGHTGGLNFVIKCYNCGVSMEHDRVDKVRGHWNQRLYRQQGEATLPTPARSADSELHYQFKSRGAKQLTGWEKEIVIEAMEEYAKQFQPKQGEGEKLHALLIAKQKENAETEDWRIKNQTAEQLHAIRTVIDLLPPTP